MNIINVAVPKYYKLSNSINNNELLKQFAKNLEKIKKEQETAVPHTNRNSTYVYILIVIPIVVVAFWHC